MAYMRAIESRTRYFASAAPGRRGELSARFREPEDAATRAPPALRPFVGTLRADEPVAGGPACRERVLPTGHMHLVFRSSTQPEVKFVQAPGPPLHHNRVRPLPRNRHGHPR